MSTLNMSATARERVISKVTWVGFFVNLVLSLAKLAAGIFGRSGAMIADAIHSLSDFVTDLVVLVFVKVAAKPENEKFDYGHGKFETLATVIIGLALVAVGGFILWQNTFRIVDIAHGHIPERPGLIALIAAAVSIIAKEALYWYTIAASKRVNSPALKANAWHHRSDALSSIATLIGIGCALFLGEKFRVLDPIAALVVGLLILKVSYDLVVPGLGELLERSLPKEEEDKIMQIIRSEFPEIKDPHKLKTRHIGAGVAIQIDIRLDGNMTVMESHLTAEAVEERMIHEFGPDTHVIVHVDPINWYKE